MAAHLVWTPMHADPPWWAVVAAAVLGALGALSVTRYMVIVGTAFGGAWMVVVGTLALMGDKAAMACTVAVEETIDEHYASQAEQLGDDEGELRTTVEKFRADELEHRDEALASGAEQAPAYPALTAAIKAGSKLAIWLSTRI